MAHKISPRTPIFDVPKVSSYHHLFNNEPKDFQRSATKPVLDSEKKNKPKNSDLYFQPFYKGKPDGKPKRGIQLNSSKHNSRSNNNSLRIKLTGGIMRAADFGNGSTYSYLNQMKNKNANDSEYSVDRSRDNSVSYQSNFGERVRNRSVHTISGNWGY